MTSNIDRAADILAEAGACCDECCSSECGEPDCPRNAGGRGCPDCAAVRGCPDCAAVVNGYARALAAAGLLAPDLPPVIVDDFDERPHVTITGTHEKDKARLRVNEHGVFHAINAWSDPMNPAEARERAYALLALANYSKGNHR